MGAKEITDSCTDIWYKMFVFFFINKIMYDAVMRVEGGEHEAVWSDETVGLRGLVFWGMVCSFVNIPLGRHD